MSSRLLSHRTVLNAARVHKMVAIRAMSTQGKYQEMGGDSSNISTALKALAGVMGAGAAIAYVQSGPRYTPLPMETPEDPAPVSKAAIVSGAVAVGAAEADGFTPSYNNLELLEGEGKLTMVWDQDGTKYAQVVDLTSGDIVQGPGPVADSSAAKEDVVVVSTPAETPTKSAPVSTPVTSTPTSTPTPAPAPTSAVEPTADHQTELKDLMQRLVSIERNLNNCCTPSAPSAGMSGYPAFEDNNTSLLKKHLTPEVYMACESKVTSNGFTFQDVIQSGVDNQDSGVGAYAGDEESYAAFAPLFDRIIEDYHNGYKPTDRHPSDMDASKLHGVADAEGDYVISTRIRVGRNIRGLGLSPGISRAQRRKVEQLMVESLNQLEGDLAGKYYSLGSMSEQDRTQLVADHFLFKKGDRFLQSAGANRDWPEARGIFHNNDKTFLVWVNEEDQMRIISMEKGADAKKIFERLSRGIAAVEAKIKAAGYEFAHNDHLGFIHSCPTNCGTGMRASVHAKLPNVGQHPDFKKWCAKLRLQPRGIHGEHSESDGGVYDLSNKERLGKSEVELVQTMIDGVKVLIEAEKALAAGKEVPAVLRA
eukprot:m.151601 g.151601  ORF g.151601 m.151601 type:complete len:591 (+) comp16342_c0_seq2:77-1849(+)